MSAGGALGARGGPTLCALSRAISVSGGLPNIWLKSSLVNAKFFSECKEVVGVFCSFVSSNADIASA